MKDYIILGLIVSIMCMTVMTGRQFARYNKLMTTHNALTSQLDKDYNEHRVE